MTVHFLVPGSLESLTGGYIYDRHVVDGLRDRGWQVDVHELDARFPFPSSDGLQKTASVLADIPDSGLVLVDGLAYGAIPDLLEPHASRLRFIPIVHLPLAADPGLGSDAAARLRALELRALAFASLVIVTGRTTLSLLEGYGLVPTAVVVAEPGTSSPRTTSPRQVRSHDGRTLRLVCVATLNPGKGHDVLLHALAPLREHPWHLTCVGSLTRHAPTAKRIGKLIRDLELADRVTMTGELPPGEVAAVYERSDVFVLATIRETYGMAVAEALAHGLPVISTETGEIPQLVGDDAGLVVPAGDAGALSAALRQVLDDPALLAGFTIGAARTGQRLPRWEQTIDTIASTLWTKVFQAG